MIWRRYIATEAWGYNLLALIALVIPLHRKLVPPAIVLALVFALYQLLRGRSRPARAQWSRLRGPLAGVIALYVFTAVGFLFTRNEVVAAKELEYKLSFLLFPLLAVCMPPLDKAQLNRLLWVFTAGCLTFLIAAISFGIYRTIRTGDSGYLAYEDLSVIFHPTYMAMYQGVALFHLMQCHQRGEWFAGRAMLHRLAMAAVVVFIAMLASKAGLISALLVCVFFALNHLRNHSGRSMAWLTSGAMIVLLLIAAWGIPVTQKRLSQVAPATPNAASSPVPAKASSALRMVAWKSGWELLRDNPLGLGTGNVQEALNGAYETRGESYALKRNLNAHSQYLQTGLEFGWAGLLVLVTTLLGFFRQAVKLRNQAFIVIAAMLLFHCLAESMLEVQAGIVFSAFWITCLALTAPVREVSADRA
jgi:O-antigen ligase